MQRQVQETKRQRPRASYLDAALRKSNDACSVLDMSQPFIAATFTDDNRIVSLIHPSPIIKAD
jgi:hypothetical protein